MKIYRGSAAAARTYVEADRSRVDDYYLAEGTGVADRYVASPLAPVRHVGTLTGDAYEAWVAGHDPNTLAPKGRLRTDGQAVRFVEVVVNGPKTWSLAAALHPEIATALDAAQTRAAEQIIGWLALHATTRVGPRGRQVQVPVAEIEAAVVRHYTSRAGDPHRHLHLQINARVFAEGRWRGLHTVGVRDSLEAINGIGHAAMMCDPDFRNALAAHGYTLDPEPRRLSSWPGSSVRSAPGRHKSPATSIGARRSGGPQTPTLNQESFFAARGDLDARVVLGTKLRTYPKYRRVRGAARAELVVLLPTFRAPHWTALFHAPGGADRSEEALVADLLDILGPVLDNPKYVPDRSRRR